MQERLKKTWVTVDAQTNQKDDVKRETVYCLDDDNETEVQVNETIQGKKPNIAVDSYLCACLKRNLLSGFRYGSDIVPFSKVDQEQMKYKHDGKCFAVLGFTKQNLVMYLYNANGFWVKKILIYANLKQT